MMSWLRLLPHVFQRLLFEVPVLKSEHACLAVENCVCQAPAECTPDVQAAVHIPCCPSFRWNPLRWRGVSPQNL